MRSHIEEVVALSNTGSAIKNARVTVAKLDGTPATVYAGATGDTVLAQPILTNTGGQIVGWVDNGSYTLTIVAPTGGPFFDTKTVTIESVNGTDIANLLVAPPAHTHLVADVTGLQDVLDTQVGAHVSDTTGVHGIVDTSLLVVKSAAGLVSSTGGFRSDGAGLIIAVAADGVTYSYMSPSGFVTANPNGSYTSVIPGGFAMVQADGDQDQFYVDPTNGGFQMVGSGNPGQVRLLVRGAASQTADLQQWQNSVGTAVASVSAGGLGSFAGGVLFGGSASLYSASGVLTTANSLAVGGSTSLGSTTFSSDTLGVTGNAKITNVTAATVALIVKGATSQTAELQQWQNSAGSSLAFVNSTGGFSAPLFSANILQLGAAGTGIQRNSGTGEVTYSSQALAAGSHVFTLTHAGQGLKVKAAASHTANLQEWQNSAGTNLVAISAAGQLFVGSNVSLASGGDLNNTSGGGNIRLYGLAAVISRRPHIFGVSADMTNAETQMTTRATTTATVITNKALTTNVATLTTSAAHGYVVGRAVVVTGVDATFNGTYTITSVPTTTTFTYGKTATDVASAASAGGAVSVAQTGDILKVEGASTAQILYRMTAAGVHEWRSGNGTNDLVAGINAGAPTASSGTFAASRIAAGPTTGGGNPLFVMSEFNGNIPVIVRGASGQSVDLTQWQNSAGTVVASVGSGGILHLRTDRLNVGSGIAGFLFEPNGGGTSPTVSAPRGFQADALNFGNVALIAKGSGSTVPISNKALTTNVATLTTSTAHGFVTGRSVVVTGVDTTFNGTYTITSVPTTTTFAYAKTAADVASTAATGSAVSYAQTSDLQQWQNHAGTKMLSVGPEGVLTIARPDGTTPQAFSVHPTVSGLQISGQTFIGGDVRSDIGFNASTTGNGTVMRPGYLQHGNGGRFSFGVGSTGAMTSIAPNQAGAGTWSTGLYIGGLTATGTPLVLQGAASQTADLQQWQNSANTVLDAVKADGTIEVLAAGKGIKLKSPDGLVTKTLTIDNAGNLVVA